MTVRDLKCAQSAIVTAVRGEASLRQHFLDLGIIPGAEVTLLKVAPMGDPVEILVQGYTLTLRISEAALIDVEPVPERSMAAPNAEEDFAYNLSLHEHNSHPGLGEEGKYHTEGDANALPKGAKISLAIVGQQNSGKTTLFNQMTGANQHVGNFPGVTLDSKEAPVLGRQGVSVTDLPGIYSFSTSTDSEKLSKDFLLGQRPNAIINILDINNIERNLYLTMQLIELGLPMVVALNMMDELHGNGGSVRVNEMERVLGVPVVPIAASRAEAIDELIDHAEHIARHQEKPLRQDFCDKEEFGGAVHRCLHSIMHLVEDHAAAAGIPARFAASRLVEGDNDILNALRLDSNEVETLEHIITEMERERGLDRHAAMAEMRYSFIRKLCSRTVVKPLESREQKRTLGIDRILTGKWTAMPAFIAIIVLVFWLTFDVIGAWLQKLLAGGIDALGADVNTAFLRWDVSETIRSMVVDAIFGGVGAVLSFVPILVVLFFFLSMLEDSGYMARIAFVSDKLLRKIGLSGRSIVPLLISFGCSVPGVMATRTLPSARDRRRTIFLIPFMSCSAKITVYGFLASAFFPGKAGLVVSSLYLLGIVLGVLVALAGKLFRREKVAAPFVMELPVYRLPKLKNVAHLLWDRTRDFLENAFSVIFVATLVIWFLKSFDFSLNMVDGGQDSMLAVFAGVLSPLMNPVGLGDWRIVIALISGFMAKESIVSALKVLGVSSLLTPVTAVPMLVFCLLYTPCVAAIASIKRELGTGWALFILVFQCLVAWLAAWAAYMIVL